MKTEVCFIREGEKSGTPFMTTEDQAENTMRELAEMSKREVKILPSGRLFISVPSSPSIVYGRPYVDPDDMDLLFCQSLSEWIDFEVAVGSYHPETLKAIQVWIKGLKEGKTNVTSCLVSAMVYGNPFVREELQKVYDLVLLRSQAALRNDRKTNRCSWRIGL